MRVETEETGATEVGTTALVEEAPPAASGGLFWHLGGYWTIIRDVYLTVDRRTLGFTRILLGFLLVMDLFRRTPDWLHMFSDKGVLPTHVNLWRPQAYGAFSFLNAFSTAPELWALWVFALLTFLCVLVGYRTRIAHVISVFLVASMNGRVLLIENGGYVVYSLLVMWTAFLPMGDRFSLDSLLDSMRRRKEATAEELNDRTDVIDAARLKPYVSLVVGAILVQIAAIYYFNVIHKTGPAWRNGTAVHYVLYVDRMVTPLVAAVRNYVPAVLILFSTKFVLMAEATIPIALASPLGRTWARRLAAVLMCLLHLGFGTTFVLGPFAWALCVFSTLLYTTDDWELVTRTMRRAHRARVVIFDPKSAGQLWFCRLLKRLDLYELLTFRAQEGLEGGIAVEKTEGSALLHRHEAFADIVAALPLGPTKAWAYRLPGFSHLIDAIWNAAIHRNMEKTFGFRIPRAPGPWVSAEPTPIRRKWRSVVAVLRELAVAAMFAGAVNQALTELWVVNRRVKIPQHEALRLLSHKLRYLQGWFMFSPNPVMDDGTIVVDAKTIDGRSIDPFTGKTPDFDLLSAKSLRYNQIWCDYFNRMHLPANSAYRDAMKEYIYRYPERTGHPEDTITSGDVYWVQDLNPPFGKTDSYKLEKNKLFSFENPATRTAGAAAGKEGTPGLPALDPARGSAP